jgi:hypothetical protein
LVLRSERLRFARQLGVASEPELGFDSPFERGEAEVFEPGDLGLAKGS